MKIPHDEGFRDPRTRPLVPEWVVLLGCVALIALGVLHLTGVFRLPTRLGGLQGPSWGWMVIGLGIVAGFAIVARRRARRR